MVRLFRPSAAATAIAPDGAHFVHDIGMARFTVEHGRPEQRIRHFKAPTEQALEERALSVLAKVGAQSTP